MNKTFSPNIKKKIKIKGLNQEVSLNQFKKIKALDKKKLIAERDNYKSQIKALEKEYNNLQVVYDPTIMKRIGQNRENELRTAIYHISKQLHNKNRVLKEDTNELYFQLLENIKQIYDKILKEINDKKLDILQRIDLRLGDCDYKQKKLLDEKILEQETILRSLHAFTFDMQRVKDNYEVIRTKINSQLDSNFELEQKIKQEVHRNNQITSLLNEYKNRINDMVKSINEMKTELNYNLPINKSEKMKQMKDILSSTENIATTNIETEYTNNNGRVNTVSTNNINRSEANALWFLNRNYKCLLSKRNNILRKHNDTIPDNAIYNTVIKTINKMKHGANYMSMFNTSNYKYLDKNMITIPIQNQDFRKEFMNELLNNGELLHALQDDTINSFNRNLFVRK